MPNCDPNAPIIHYFNLCDYSLTDLIIVGIGTLFWVISYGAIIRHGFKNKFLEMPLYVAAGNIGWEFVWSFLFQTNMGEVYLWGYRIWFFMDVVIFYLLVKYGAKQFKVELFKRYTVPILIGLTVFFGFFFYYFAAGGYDTPIGATSAFFLSVGISTLYISLLLSNKNPNNFSLLAAVSRALGDIILTVFVWKYYGIAIIGVMGIYVILLDTTYVLLLYRMKKKAKAIE